MTKAPKGDPIYRLSPRLNHKIALLKSFSSSQKYVWYEMIDRDLFDTKMQRKKVAELSKTY